MLKLAGCKTQLPRRDSLLPGSEPPHAHTTCCRSATILLGLVVPRSAAGGQGAGAAYLTPGNLHGSRETRETHPAAEARGAGQHRPLPRQLRRGCSRCPSQRCPRLLANPVLGRQPRHPRSPSALRGELLPGRWSWLPMAERRVGPGSRCRRAEPLPGPEAPARGEPARACPGEKGPLGSPGPRLCCRQSGPCPCPPRGPRGSSSPQPLPPAPPPPAKPPARAAPSLPLRLLLPERGQRQRHARAPSPLLRHTQLCPGAPGALGPPSCSVRGARVQHGREAAPTASSPPAPSHPPGLRPAAQCQCQHITQGRGPPPALPAAALPFTPAPARRAQRLAVGYSSVLEGYLPPDQPAGSSTPGPQTGRGTPNGASRRCQAPGLPVPLPLHRWQHFSLPCLGPWLFRAPRAHTLGPGQHRHGGAEDAGGGPAATPLFCGPGSLQPSPPCGWGHRGSL